MQFSKSEKRIFTETEVQKRVCFQNKKAIIVRMTCNYADCLFKKSEKENTEESSHNEPTESASKYILNFRNTRICESLKYSVYNFE